MSHWYLLQAKPRQETKAQDELAKQGYEVFLPTIEVEKISQGTRVHRTEPLFSRYLFIRLNQTTDNWSPIRSTKGVSQLIRFAGKPASIDHVQLQSLKELLTQQRSQPLFKKGSCLDVVSGPFQSLSVVFEKIITLPTGEESAMVLLDVLGKLQRLTLNLSALRMAA